jgi:hypothetical protein
MSVISDLYAFDLDRQRCDELDGGIEGDATDPDARVWFTCSCGAMISRRADDEDADETTDEWRAPEPARSTRSKIP